MRAYAAAEESSSFKAGLVLGLVLLLNVFLYLFYLRHANDATSLATNQQQGQEQQQEQQNTIKRSTAEWQTYFSERRAVQESQTCDQIGTCVCFLVRVGPRHAKSIPSLVWGLLAGKYEDFRVVLMEVEVPRFMPYLLKIHNQTRNDPRVIVSPELPVVNTYGFEQVNNEIDRQVAQGRCSHFVITSGDYLYTHPYLERVVVKLNEYEDFMQSEYVSRGNQFQVTKKVPLLGVSILSRELLKQNPEIRFKYKDLPSGLFVCYSTTACLR